MNPDARGKVVLVTLRSALRAGEMKTYLAMLGVLYPIVRGSEIGPEVETYFGRLAHRPRYVTLFRDLHAERARLRTAGDLESERALQQELTGAILAVRQTLHASLHELAARN